MQCAHRNLAMKMIELKEELEARGEGKTGNKAWLRRRLHAAIVRNFLAAMAEGMWSGYNCTARGARPEK